MSSRPAPFLYTVELDIAEADLPAIYEWYEKEHLPLLTSVPGCIGGTRYKRLDDGRAEPAGRLPLRAAGGEPIPRMDRRPQHRLVRAASARCSAARGATSAGSWSADRALPQQVAVAAFQHLHAVLVVDGRPQAEDAGACAAASAHPLPAADRACRRSITGCRKRLDCSRKPFSKSSTMCGNSPAPAQVWIATW